MAKGAVLIAVAVVIGIVLLQVVDDGSTGRVIASGGDGRTTTTTADKQGAARTTTTTTPAAPPKNPDQLRLLVLNGGAPAGSAGTMSEALKQKGYTNQEPANDDNKSRTGNIVYCREGFSREAAALAVAVGAGTTAEAFPAPAPPFSDKADCVVVVGKAPA